MDVKFRRGKTVFRFLKVERDAIDKSIDIATLVTRNADDETLRTKAQYALDGLKCLRDLMARPEPVPEQPELFPAEGTTATLGTTEGETTGGGDETLFGDTTGNNSGSSDAGGETALTTPADAPSEPPKSRRRGKQETAPAEQQ